MLSFRDPCDISDYVVPGHARIGACDMLSVFPCILFILKRCLRLKPEKRPLIIDLFYISLSKYCSWWRAVILYKVRTKRQFGNLCSLPLMMLAATRDSKKNGHYSSFCRSCTCVVSPYKMYGYVRRIYRPRQHLEIWLRQQTVKIGLTILLGFTSALIQWFISKNHSQGTCRYVWRRVRRTKYSDAFSNWTRTHHWCKMPYF